jgi:hypothetical protein
MSYNLIDPAVVIQKRLFIFSGKKPSRFQNCSTAKVGGKVGNADAFKMTPKNITGSPGKIEVFECQLKNNSGEVSWYKDDKKINKMNFR